MEVLLYFWIGTAILSIVILVTNPKRNDVTDNVQKFRTLAVGAGFVPCAGLSLIAQLVYLGVYRAALARGDSRNRRLSSQLETSFGTSTTQPKPAPPASGPGTDAEPKGGDAANPFM